MRTSIAISGCIVGLLSGFNAFSQYAGDAFRYSEINQNGTARFQSLGGNHAAIGGDASSIFGNPAGLGFYNRSEVAITPVYTSVNSKTDYIGDINNTSKGKFNLAGHASAVFTSQPGFQRKWKRSSFGISYSRQQSFRQEYRFTGFNQNSAYLNKVVEDVNRSGATPSQLEADFDPGTSSSGPLAYSIPAAYYQLYLINPSGVNGPPYTAVDNESPLEQVGTYNATGANTQWTLAYGGNYNDKLYVGGSVGINRIRYKYDRVLQDNYVDSPELNWVDQHEGLTVTGVGINATLGIIYKVNPLFQFGGSLTTPTFSSYRETFSQAVEANYVDGQVTGPEGTLITPDYTYIPLAANDFEYRVVSPFRGSLGGTVFIKNDGFITGTVEYVGYAGMRANTSYLDDAGNRDFKEGTIREIKDIYRNTVNVRVGGEYRVGKFRARAGMGYMADPYVDRANIDRSRLLYSLGAGVRGDRFFADLGGTLSTSKSVYTPYTLNNPAFYSSAVISDKTVNVMLTVGAFF
ncbi:hypothetical protein DSL64_05855 [Dyadobacter luteus]|jgi:hypothetical protein|uniref:Aromatic hydrocarbon degradation protein n=1 Tax=Dyadobacter luteus TaxID=2259619 RepID=A0A3D8YFQ0_9BACT|nr:hypothetical protein [Dyadobacter luteus]REA63140.1 hypothetical protein DSL64_05855 [Dyadobacter luteus]